LYCWAWIALAAISFGAFQTADAETLVPRNHHPWGRFEIGSWKRVSLVSETLNDKNEVVNSSTQITTTTLVDVDEKSYTLYVEYRLEVAGRVYKAQPQIFKRGYNGESEGQHVTLKKIGAGTVTIGGNKIPTEIRQVIINGGKTKQDSLVHYSDKVSPYVLKRETTNSKTGKATPKYTTTVEVLEVEMPYRNSTETISSSHIKTVQNQAHGSITTIEVHCNDIPGGVVSHTSKESNKAGQVIRRSTLELMDYNISDGADNLRFGVRRRWKRKLREAAGNKPQENR